ncbi:MAG: hypothetical protein KC656_28235 [Myxococcales bacterium]|nr:hypothetical protein [Myxococcales bacterium]MCB9691364.1 hypothetical protein [Alphaproteobacteria bacterium]
MSALCVRCGFTKADYLSVCPDCGHRPEGDGVLVGWLLSSENLDEAQMVATAARIRSGEPIRPSRKMLAKARRALGRQVATDPGLGLREALALLGANVLFSPLVGWTCAAWWWSERPRASLQAVLLSAPASVAMTALWLWVGTRGAT